MTLALVIFLAFADLGAVKSEPDLNKRSELALQNANQALDEAHQASQANNDKALTAALAEVDDSVAVCYQSLEQTHSTPRKSRYYKRAELKLSALLRRLSALRDRWITSPSPRWTPSSRRSQALTTSCSAKS